MLFPNILYKISSINKNEDNMSGLIIKQPYNRQKRHL